jgi:hypothetical protein
VEKDDNIIFKPKDTKLPEEPQPFQKNLKQNENPTEEIKKPPSIKINQRFSDIQNVS